MELCWLQDAILQEDPVKDKNLTNFPEGFDPKTPRDELLQKQGEELGLVIMNSGDGFGA